jgi:hypothetical protein
MYTLLPCERALVRNVHVQLRPSAVRTSGFATKESRRKLGFAKVHPRRADLRCTRAATTPVISTSAGSTARSSPTRRWQVSSRPRPRGCLPRRRPREPLQPLRSTTFNAPQSLSANRRERGRSFLHGRLEPAGREAKRRKNRGRDLGGRHRIRQALSCLRETWV